MAENGLPRNIVLCSDGTGNSGAKWNGTNVWRTFMAVDKHDYETWPRCRQIAFYDQGVGTSSFKPLKALGGAFGLGLSKNIRDLYTDLAKIYEEGSNGRRSDNIYIFGFSRGAFTARSLAGMIADVGVIDGRKMDNRELEKRVKQAYHAYRSKNYQQKIAQLRSECPVQHANIRFVGVWDTVDAIGVPADELRWVIYKILHSVLRPHNYGLDEKMKCVRHAVAIDDQRRTFSPDLYDEAHAEALGVDLQQVWFSGAHSNVGGGYPRQGMSDVALDWMMVEAYKQGLRFTAEARREVQSEMDVHSTLYDPRSGPSAYYRYLPRDIGALSAKAQVKKPKIHVTAMDRIELATADYAPTNLPEDFEVVGTRPSDAERVKRCNDCVAASREHRRKKFAATGGLIFWRKVLYAAFLALTVLVAILGWRLLVDEETTIQWVRERAFPRSSQAIANLWAALPDAVAGRLETVGGAVGKLLVAVVPEAATRLVTALLKLPGIVILVAVIAFLMVAWKRRLVGSMRHLGLSTWKEVYRRHGGA